MPRTPAAFAPGDCLGRFEILGSLGAGGMGEVFRAWDPVLEREVAIKTLPAELASDAPRLERMAREAKALAALNHPHIVTLYSVEEADGHSFLTMELVEGETLDHLIPERGLPLDDFFALAIPLADALAVAHERGVIHRDLKPRNLMVTGEGRLKVLDFGLAHRGRPWGAQTGEEGSTETWTRPGAVLGTLGYASPEQLDGKPVDSRADIFSLGVVLYEMLSGVRPFPGDSPMEVVTSILRDAPVPLPERRPGLPRHLSRIVHMCLEKAPASRFQSARDVKNELASLQRELSGEGAAIPSAIASRAGRGADGPPESETSRGPLTSASAGWRSWGRRAAVAGLIGAVAVTLGLLSRSRAPVAPISETPIVAVLPLANATGDPGNDHLGLGFADSLINRLAGIPSVAVVSRGAIGEYALASAGRERIAREQGVTYLVDGSVQRVNGRLQVTINLVDATRSVVRRSWEQEGTLEGLFELQRRLAVDVGRGLMLTLSEADQRRLESPLSGSVLAFNDYSRARLLLQRPDRPESLAQAIRLLEGAVDRDPSFALAHAALGDAYWIQYNLTREPELADRAVASIQRAARLDSKDPEVAISLARIYDGTGRRDQALELLSNVLERQPFSDEGWRLLATLLEREGRDQEALAALERALSVRPGHWRNFFALGVLHFRAGRLHEATESFARITILHEDNLWAWENFGAMLQAVGDLEGALQIYRRADELGLESEVMQSNLGVLHFWTSDFESAAASFGEAIRIAPLRAQYHYGLGRAYQGMGRVEEAQQAFLRAIEISARQLEVNPEDTSALSLSALAEAHLGRLDEALRRAQRTVELAPTSSQAHYRYAKVSLLAGRESEALGALAEAVEHGQSVEILRRDPDWAGLREHPVFRLLVREDAATGST